MAVRPLGEGRYAVDAESGATYVVDLREGSCTCPDERIRGERCKHLRRVAIEITSRRVPPPGRARAACDACDRETLVDEDADPPHLCDACGVEPGDVVRDRETGDRMVVRRVTDRRADEVFLDAAATTVADYPTNDGYPADDLVVDVTYLGDLRRDDAREYSFPLSRIERVEDVELLA